MSDVTRLAAHAALAGLLLGLFAMGDPSWRFVNLPLAALNAWCAGRAAARLDARGAA